MLQNTQVIGANHNGNKKNDHYSGIQAVASFSTGKKGFKLGTGAEGIAEEANSGKDEETENGWY